MKNLKSNVIISLIMIFAAMVLFASPVNASSSFIFGNDTSSDNTERNTTTTTTNTIIRNTTTTTPKTTTTTNSTVVNNINDNATKDLPKTGETDTYVIATVGIIAIIVGGIAFIASKKDNK